MTEENENVETASETALIQSPQFPMDRIELDNPPIPQFPSDRIEKGEKSTDFIKNSKWNN